MHEDIHVPKMIEMAVKKLMNCRPSISFCTPDYHCTETLSILPEIIAVSDSATS